MKDSKVNKQSSEDKNKAPKPSKYVKKLNVTTVPNSDIKEVKKLASKSHKIKKYDIVFYKNILRKINVESNKLVCYQIIFLLQILLLYALSHALYNF